MVDYGYMLLRDIGLVSWRGWACAFARAANRPGDDTAFGGPLDDRVAGNEGNDTLWGNFGSDTISGGPGDDFIDGDNPSPPPPDLPFPPGTNNDICTGGPGDGTVNNCEVTA